MNNRFKGLRPSLVAVLGLCLSILIAASGASAAEWRIEGKKITETEVVSGAKHTEANFLVPSLNIGILCAKHTIKDGLILTSGEVHGTIELTSCKTITLSTGLENKACKPTEPVVATGRAKPFLHNGLTYILVLPPNGSTIYTTVKFSELCALPEEDIVKGTAVGECLNLKLEKGAGFCEEEAVTHLGQMAPQALFPSDQIFFGQHAVTYDGIAEVWLAGKNFGKKASAFG
jgi:hypothetical protein